MKNFVRRFLSLDKITQVFILIIVFCVVSVIKVNVDVVAKGVSTIELGEKYISNVLNFTIEYPKGWAFDEDEETVLTSITPVTHSIPFDTFKHELKKEVTPLILLAEAGDTGHKKFLSLSMNSLGVQDLEKVKEYNKGHLKKVVETTSTDVIVTDSKIVDDELGRFVLTRLEGTDKETKQRLQFVDLTTPAGVNFASLLAGGNKLEKKDILTMETVLNSLKFFEGKSVPAFTQSQDLSTQTAPVEKSDEAPEFETDILPTDDPINKKE